MRQLPRPVMFVLCVGGLLFQLAHGGERTYRWTDEKGRVHYSDMKSEKSEQVEVKPGSGVYSAPKDSPAAIAARQLDCQRKRDQLTVYGSSSEITETDSLGNTRTYSAAERQKLLERTQQQVDAACNPTATNADGASGNAPQS